MPQILRRIAVGALCMCALVVLGVQPAAAASKHHRHTHVPAAASAKSKNKQDALCKQANKLRKLVIRKHGKRAPGRDICQYGMRDGSKPTHHDELGYKQTLYRIAHPPPPVTTVTPTSTPSTSTTSTTTTTSTPTATSSSYSAPASSTLSAIAQCESGGNPSAVSPNGAYRGKYQFTYGTWRSVGGTGDPAAASESEQDYRASLLYGREGAQPWPVCGR